AAPFLLGNPHRHRGAGKRRQAARCRSRVNRRVTGDAGRVTMFGAGTARGIAGAATARSPGAAAGEPAVALTGRSAAASSSSVSKVWAVPRAWFCVLARYTRKYAVATRTPPSVLPSVTTPMLATRSVI